MSVELVLDYATGNASIVVSAGFGLGNGSGVGGSASNGYIYGSGNSTQTAAQAYASGGNTTGGVTIPIGAAPLPFGLTLSGTANSGGIMGNPATLSTSAMAFSVGIGGGMLNWNFPIPSAQAQNTITTYDLGNFMTGPLSSFFPFTDQLLGFLKQACN